MKAWPLLSLGGYFSPGVWYHVSPARVACEESRPERQLTTRGCLFTLWHQPAAAECQNLAWAGGKSLYLDGRNRICKPLVRTKKREKIQIISIRNQREDTLGVTDKTLKRIRGTILYHFRWHRYLTLKMTPC